jgi:hypothetical protein
MRANERYIFVVVAGLALAVAFWFLVLSPKRDKVDELDLKLGQVQQAVGEQEQRVEFGEAAKKSFASDYSKIVVLGKAAPDNGDTASFLEQLDTLAVRNKIDLREVRIEPGDTSAAPAVQPGIGVAPPASSQPSTTAPAPEGGETPADTGDTQPIASAPATEASAASLPIGAGVGPAGLNTLKYKLAFRGRYLDVTNFMAAVDELVHSSDGRIAISGRLSTVDGFALLTDPSNDYPFPFIRAELGVTTYTTPRSQGITAGATPSGPSILSGDTPQLASSPGGTP